MSKFYLYLIIFLHAYQIFAQERLSSIQGISTGSLPNNFVETSNKVYFKATHEYSGRELYCFDKNSKVVKIVGDFFEGPNSTFDNYFPWTLGKVGEYNYVNFRDKLYFLGKSKSIYDIPLIYETNGESTKIRQDLSEEIKGTPFQIYKTDSLLIFFALNDERNRISIWKSNGTLKNMNLVAEIAVDGSPYYPVGISNVKITSNFISFSPTSTFNYNYNIEYLVDLNTNLVNQRSLKQFESIGSFKTENFYLTYKVENDSVKFSKTDLKESQVFNEGIKVWEYFNLSTIKILKSNNPNVFYSIYKKSRSIYEIYKIDLVKLKVQYVTEIGNNSDPLTPFLYLFEENLFYVTSEYKNPNITITSLNSIDLRNSKTKSIYSWTTDGSVPFKNDKLIGFDFDSPPVFVATGSRIVMNMRVIDTKNNFQSFTESWLIDTKDNKAVKLNKFTLTANETIQISANNIFVSGSVDSLLLTPEPFLINFQTQTAIQVAQINKGKNFINSVNLEKKVVFWRTSKDKGTEIYSSDGSKVGTKLIRKIDNMTISGVKVVNNHLFFVASRVQNANLRQSLVQLYVTDGTTSNTFIASEFIYPNDNIYFNLFSYQNKCYFKSYDLSSKSFFVVSDGTKQNSKFFESPVGEIIDNIYPSQNQDYIYFTANKYINNGKSQIASLYEITDIDQKPTLLFTHEIISNGYRFGLKNVFRNPIILNIREKDYQILNKEGKEIKVISNDSNNLVHYKDYVVGKFSFMYFRDKKSQSDLIWQSDGTLEGTKMVTNSKLLKILFVNNRSYNDYEVSPEREIIYVNQNGKIEKWLTDGSEENTFLIEDERDIYKLYPNKKAFLAPTNNLYNYALWVSNGTKEGTYKRIDSLSNEAYYGLWLETNDFIGLRKKGYFLLFDVKKDTLHSFFPENISKYHIPSNFAVIENNLLFFGIDKETSTQLWRFYIDETKGIEEEKVLENLSINIFPNPTHNEILIDYSPKNTVIQILISDLQGKIVKSQEFITPFVAQIPIYVSELPAGIYILYIKDGVEMISKRIAKF